ncbi:DUF3871 family protein [Maribellus luteus]|uniref:DUF3871 family protein n=1 Tax=Maribellus luteus TaxID=2305463 RepID=A0A399SQ85_9BACT|nr:DUF3871 family protein [Maribellus luteus]RIJ45518.1 DUF3871 family protein [Maribellus luteus]
MELVKVNDKAQLKLVPSPTAVKDNQRTSSDVHFMAANTEIIGIDDMRKKHTIPVFAKDNESTISHQEFIETVEYVTKQIFGGEHILSPAVRVSHPIKGRIPCAVGKPAKELLEHEKTLYFERMAFAIEIASIKDKVAGNELNLTVGGVRAYNLDNLHSTKRAESFRLFIGFKNSVCCNLCVSTDGFRNNIKVRTIAELAKSAYNLFGEFNAYKEIEKYSSLPDTVITESQFAQIVGRARLYQNMPWKNRKDLPAFPLMDNQVTQIVKDFYSDESFCRDEAGNINLWKLYNLFTGANKSSYIDSFLDRGVECQHFVGGLHQALSGSEFNWFLN